MTICLLLVGMMINAADVPKPDLAAAIRLYSLGEYQKAIETLSAESRQNPRAGDYNLWLGKSYLRLRRWDEAIREFERAVLIDPASSFYHLWLGRAFGRKAEHTPFFLALGPARKLLKEFETAVRLSPGNVDAHFDLLEFYLSAPGIIGGGRDHARSEVNKIAQIDARLGYTAQSRYFEADKKYDLARDELVQATIKYPDRAGAFADLADYYFRRLNYAEAAPAAEKAVELSRPIDHKAQLILLASWVLLKKNLAESEEGLEALSRGPLDDDDPSFEDVYYWLGQARLARGNKADARRAFEKALRFNPDHARAKAALALVR